MADKNAIFAHVKRKIAELDADTSKARAARAKLRRAAGKPPGTTPEVWDITITGAPVELDSQGGNPSREETAVHTALTLYALHRQSKDASMSTEDVSFGAAVARLRGDDNEEAIKRRFNAVATSVDFTELAYHARGIVSLLRSKEIKLDYPRFASDLYWFQFPEYADRVRLRWGRDFYRYDSDNDKKEGDK